MFKHYLTTALRHFTRHKATTAINIACLSAGLLCFMFALGVVNFLDGSDRHHSNADRTYVVTTQLSRGNGEAIFPAIPNSALSVAKHLQASSTEPLVVARASIFGQETSLAAGDRKRAVATTYVDPEFTTIFDLPFIIGDARTALAAPRSIVLTAELSQQLFGSVDTVGRSLLLDGRETVQVTGVIEAPRQPSHMSTTDRNASLFFQALASMDLHEAAIRDREPADIAAIRFNRPFGLPHLRPVTGRVG
jgi:hypothetical protein